jgi:hypothetical protein
MNWEISAPVPTAQVRLTLDAQTGHVTSHVGGDVGNFLASP